jgi:hypothetical protein
LAALVLFLLFSALVLPGQSAEAERISGEAGSPDTSLVYAPAHLYHMAESYGPEGRKVYLRARWTFDLVFPLVYTLFLVTAISWVFARVVQPASTWRLANLAPLLAMLLDFAENSATSLVIGRYPARTPVVDLLAPAFTFAKWIFVGGSFLLLVVGGVAAIWRRTRDGG